MGDYGLIGEKLGHSFSAVLHGKMNIPSYELMEIPKERIEEYLTRSEFKGINVTIPYKEIALRHCIPDERALAIGSVNTLVKRDGKVYGFNTDCLGFSAMLKKAGICVSGKKVVILGSGGTAKTACFQCYTEGAREITVVSRKANSFPVSYAEADKCRVSFVTYEQSEFYRDAQVLVNTTPVGMFPNNDAMPMNPDVFDGLCGVADVVYNPLETKLVAWARKRNIPAVNGLYMLVAQAWYAEELFFGEEFDGEKFPVEKVFARVLSEKKNIVLIGMPGSGKSTVSRILAERTGREVFDTDEEFEKEFGVFPGDYIEEYGEQAFREKESEVVKKNAARNGVILATGGGSILRPENVEALKSNGTVIYLKRDLDQLSSKGRPLSKNAGVEALFEKRRPIYESSADIIIANNGKEGISTEASVGETCDVLEKELKLFYENTCN